MKRELSNTEEKGAQVLVGGLLVGGAFMIISALAAMALGINGLLTVGVIVTIVGLVATALV